MTRAPQVGDAFGRYHIDRLIGMGGMGMVFVATDTSLNRRVALKVVSARLSGAEEFLERFHREAGVLARLNSPHITQIFDHGEHDEVPYIATQFVPGGDLSRLLKGRGPMPVSLAAAICAQVADALDDAHRAGVVHRDVKPGNVLLRDPDHPQPQAYLCDFGIAQTEHEGGLTVAGGVAGTMTYLSPERIRGDPATPASDTYAVGCLLWATLTGAAPYTGTDVQVAQLHREGPIPQFRGQDETSRALNRILQLSMAKDPADRYPCANALKQNLVELSSSAAADFDASDHAASSAPTQKLRRVRRRRRILVPVLALLLVGGVGGVWWTQRGDDVKTPTAGTGKPEPIQGDLDGDGLGDLQLNTWMGEASPYQTAIWHADGETAAALTPAEKSEEQSAPLVGDFDGDRLPDQSAESSPDQPVSITYGDGTTGSMPAPGRKELVNPAGTLAGDFNGDGKDDIAIIEDGDGDLEIIHVRLNQGERFGKAEEWITAPIGPYEADWAVGDFDGDGDDDVTGIVPGDTPYRGSTTVNARLLLLTSTTDTFEAADEAPDLGVESWQIDLFTGDFDGDGVADIAVGSNSYGTVGVTVSGVTDGSATTPVSWLSTELDIGRDDRPLFTASDVNGDRKSDALVIQRDSDDWGSGDGGPIHLALSDGDALGDLEEWADCPSCNFYTTIADEVR
ncbi:MAG: serine/threonine protein kinase [Nocardioides sp.]|nr:serine/threonine protein kinase [Nocardioides sp.]